MVIFHWSHFWSKICLFDWWLSIKYIDCYFRANYLFRCSMPTSKTSNITMFHNTQQRKSPNKIIEYLPLIQIVIRLYLIFPPCFFECCRCSGKFVFVLCFNCITLFLDVCLRLAISSTINMTGDWLIYTNVVTLTIKNMTDEFKTLHSHSQQLLGFQYQIYCHNCKRYMHAFCLQNYKI